MKRITPENWLESDVARMLNGLEANEWVEEALRPKLNPSVPQTIQDLFEVARSAVIYGWFYHHLGMLGVEQMFRVEEAAIKAKCVLLGIPTKIAGKDRATTFHANIKALVAQGLMSGSFEQQWLAARKLRNRTSHASETMLLSPGYLLGMPDTAAEMINRLFS
jgi:hypothetical protein